MLASCTSFQRVPCTANPDSSTESLGSSREPSREAWVADAPAAYRRSEENFLELAQGPDGCSRLSARSRGSTAKWLHGARSNKQPSRLRAELARNSSSRLGGPRAPASALAPRCLSNVFRGGGVTARVALFIVSSTGSRPGRSPPFPPVRLRARQCGVRSCRITSQT